MPYREFDNQNCSIARTLALIGERWTLLVLRDIFRGHRRFDSLQRGLGVASNILSDRLGTLLEAGVISRRAYGVRADRFEYRLTQKGLDLQPILLELMAWGDRYEVGASGPPRVLHHHACDHDVEPLQVCSHCREPLAPRTVEIRLGPGATAAERARTQAA